MRLYPQYMRPFVHFRAATVEEKVARAARRMVEGFMFGKWIGWFG
jgi:hypothetical protein